MPTAGPTEAILKTVSTNFWLWKLEKGIWFLKLNISIQNISRYIKSITFHNDSRYDFIYQCQLSIRRILLRIMPTFPMPTFFSLLIHPIYIICSLFPWFLCIWGQNKSKLLHSRLFTFPLLPYIYPVQLTQESLRTFQTSLVLLPRCIISDTLHEILDLPQNS